MQRPWSWGEPGAFEDLRGGQCDLRVRKLPGRAELWRPCLDFGLYPRSSGKPLKSFNVGSDMMRLALGKK